MIQSVGLKTYRIGIRSLNTIVSNMLHFANPLSPAFCTVNLHEIIQEILRFVGSHYEPARCPGETKLNAEDPVIVADPELIKQMLLNLIFNAMKAMPSQGSLTISTVPWISAAAIVHPVDWNCRSRIPE